MVAPKINIYNNAFSLLIEVILVERTDFSRGDWVKAAAVDGGHQQAFAARLQQAHDLLPD